MTKRTLANWWVGIVLAFGVFAPRVRMFQHDWTRYFAFWGRSDAIAITLLVLALGTLFWLAHTLIRRSNLQYAHRLSDALFVIIATLVGIAYLASGKIHLSYVFMTPLYPVLAIVSVILSLASMFGPMRWIPRTLRATCLIVSPIVPLIFWQLFQYANYSVTQETIPTTPVVRPMASAPQDGEPGDVFMFIFDAWSYERTFQVPGFNEEFPHLSSLVRQSTLYRDAHAPFPETRRSIPGILYQTGDHYHCDQGRLGFDSGDGQLVPTGRRSSLVSKLRSKGYQTAIVGWCHPYRRMFGDELDYAYSSPFVSGNGDDADIIDSVMRHGQWGLGTIMGTIPMPGALKWRVQRFWGLTDRTHHTLERLTNIHSRAQELIRNTPGRWFAVFHYPVPHGPYLFTRQGFDPAVKERWPLDFVSKGKDDFRRPDAANHIARYRGNLHYLDTLLGELVSALRSARRFDGSLLIVTADHSWRVDPRLDEMCMEHDKPLGGVAYLDPTPKELTHVPLIVKFPRQSTGEEVMEPFQINNLSSVFRRAFPESVASTFELAQAAQPGASMRTKRALHP